MRLRNLIKNKYGSWYPVGVFGVALFIAGGIYYVIDPIIQDVLSFIQDSTVKTFVSVFWKAIPVFIPILLGIWMLVYMQRKREQAML